MQPILADEIQTFKALITVHKVLQEGHPVVRHAPNAWIHGSPGADHKRSSRSDIVVGNMLTYGRLGWTER